MIKIGNSAVGKHSFLSFLLLLIPFANSAFAQQDFQLQATVSENRIFIGEQFNLHVEVSGSSMRDVSLPQLPDIDESEFFRVHRQEVQVFLLLTAVQPHPRPTATD